MINTIWSQLIPLTEATAWTLIHSLWQILLIAIILRIVLFFIPARHSQLRYGILLTGLFCTILWSLQTFQQEYVYHKKQVFDTQSISSNSFESKENISKSFIDQPQLPELTINEVSSSNKIGEFFALDIQRLKNWRNTFEPYLPMIAIFWYLGVFISSFSMIMGLIRLNRLKKQGVQPPSPTYLAIFDKLRRQMGVFRKVDFLLSSSIQEPITFHIIKPVVLAPISFFSQLSQAQAEALILHELAHIRRYDYLFNMIQTSIEVIYFYHPAIWWISSKVRQEREHCCDDLVLAVRDNPLVYAEALTRLQLFDRPSKSRLALHAVGEKGVFTKRIVRLFGQYESDPQLLKGSFLTLCLMTGLFLQSFLFRAESEQITAIDDLGINPSDIQVAPLSTSSLQQDSFSSLAPSSPALKSDHSYTKGPISPVETAPSERSNDGALLHDAIASGNLRVVTLLIEDGIDVNIKLEGDRSPLIEAAHYGEIAIAQYLIEQGAHINYVAGDGYTALMEASEHGLTTLAKLLIEKGVDIHFMSSNGHSALILAADEGHLELTQLLIENGADVHAHSGDHWDALRHAVNSGHDEIVALLIEYGAREFSVDSLLKKSYTTPIQTKVYIDWNHPVNQHHVYAQNLKDKDDVFIRAFYQLNKDCQKRVKKKKSKSIVSNKGKENSFIFSIDYGDGSLPTQYDTLKNCVHPEDKVDSDFSNAVLGNGKPIGGLPKGVQHTIRSPIGEQLEVYVNTTQLVSHLTIQLLSVMGDKVEKTLFDEQITRGAYDLKLDLEGIRKTVYLLSIAVDGQRLVQRIGKNCWMKWEEKDREDDSSSSLLDFSSSENNCKELLRAVRANQIEKVKALLQDTDPNCSYRGDGEPRSALVAAARKGYLEIGKLLIQANSDVEFHDRDDESPLMAAAKNGHLSFVQYLIEQGAQVDAVADGDGTALIHAVRSNHIKVAKLLLENGADPYLNVPGDEYAMYHARTSGNRKMVALLKQYQP